MILQSARSGVKIGPARVRENRLKELNHSLDFKLFSKFYLKGH